MDPASPVIRCLTAPNPSLMTLSGTNTYLVGEHEVVAIDPGPAIESHLQAILEAVERQGGHLVAVLATHSHADHLPGSLALGRMAGVPVHRFGGAGGLKDGSVIRTADVEIRAVHTPGHASDHLCFYVPAAQALFTGDLILGLGTTVIGDLGAYLDSLRRLQVLPLRRIYPGHGPLVEEPQAKIQEYLTHRLEREAQILRALEAGREQLGAIVAAVYADVDPRLHGAAALSVTAHLVKLEREGRVACRWDAGELRARLP
ncbi:MAG: MBL fold metallo-hydrolase [Deltaproteobacteria bacterium]|nr:MBL fold metallo-hydrolase [Deltaproteobacteria bacterium]